MVHQPEKEEARDEAAKVAEILASFTLSEMVQALSIACGVNPPSTPTALGNNPVVRNLGNEINSAAISTHASTAVPSVAPSVNRGFISVGSRTKAATLHPTPTIVCVKNPAAAYPPPATVPDEGVTMEQDRAPVPTLTNSAVGGRNTSAARRKKKGGWYVVTVGVQVGVFSGWAIVSPLVTGVPGCAFQGVESREVAEDTFRNAQELGLVREVASA